MNLFYVPFIIFWIGFHTFYLDNPYILIIGIGAIILVSHSSKIWSLKQENVKIVQFFGMVTPPVLEHISETEDREEYETFKVTFQTLDEYDIARDCGAIERYTEFLKKKYRRSICSYADLYVRVLYFSNDTPEKLQDIDISGEVYSEYTRINSSQ